MSRFPSAFGSLRRAPRRGLYFVRSIEETIYSAGVKHLDQPRLLRRWLRKMAPPISCALLARPSPPIFTARLDGTAPRRHRNPLLPRRALGRAGRASPV